MESNLVTIVLADALATTLFISMYTEDWNVRHVFQSTFKVSQVVHEFVYYFQIRWRQERLSRDSPSTVMATLNRCGTPSHQVKWQACISHRIGATNLPAVRAVQGTVCVFCQTVGIPRGHVSLQCIAGKLIRMHGTYRFSTSYTSLILRLYNHTSNKTSQ